jgi:hypothetical protein
MSKRTVSRRYDIRRAHDDYLLRRYGKEARHFGKLARKWFELARHARSIGRMEHLLDGAKRYKARARRAREILDGVAVRAWLAKQVTRSARSAARRRKGKR